MSIIQVIFQLLFLFFHCSLAYITALRRLPLTHSDSRTKKIASGSCAYSIIFNTIIPCILYQLKAIIYGTCNVVSACVQ